MRCATGRGGTESCTDDAARLPLSESCGDPAEWSPDSGQSQPRGGGAASARGGCERGTAVRRAGWETSSSSSLSENGCADAAAPGLGCGRVRMRPAAVAPHTCSSAVLSRALCAAALRILPGGDASGQLAGGGSNSASCARAASTCAGGSASGPPLRCRFRFGSAAPGVVSASAPSSGTFSTGSVAAAPPSSRAAALSRAAEAPVRLSTLAARPRFLPAGSGAVSCWAAAALAPGRSLVPEL